jgi:DNA-binding MarR family transcriptional regulator
VKKARKHKKAATPVDLRPLTGLLGYVLRRAQMVVFQDFFRDFAACDIRPAQFSVLMVIERNPGLRQSQVSAALGIKRTNFVGLFDTLEKRGLAERRQAAQDMRSYALCLTPAGATLMRKLRAVSRRHEARYIARLGEDGYAQMLALLHKLAKPARPQAASAKPKCPRRATRAGAARKRAQETRSTTSRGIG